MGNQRHQVITEGHRMETGEESCSASSLHAHSANSVFLLPNQSCSKDYYDLLVPLPLTKPTDLTHFWVSSGGKSTIHRGEVSLIFFCAKVSSGPTSFLHQHFWHVNIPNNIMPTSASREEGRLPKALL